MGIERDGPTLERQGVAYRHTGIIIIIIIMRPTDETEQWT
jgi:hypothetical protein